MTAQDAMKLFVAEELQPALKARVFQKRAFTFYRRVERNYAIIQLQKSRSSSAQVVEFTINVGVFSTRVHAALDEVTWVPEVKGVPTEPDCQLRRRIGFLAPERRDLWWAIGPTTDRGSLGCAIRTVLESHALPFLESCTTDEGLRDYWLASFGSAPEGLALAVLLRDIGPQAALRPLLDRMLEETPESARLLRAAIAKLAAQSLQT